MPNKKLSKIYFGIPKTPIDDNTVFYLPLDGDTKELISGQTLNLGTGSFKPMPTGLGYKFNGDSATPINISGLNPNECTIDMLVNFDDLQDANSAPFTLMDSSNYRTAMLVFVKSTKTVYAYYFTGQDTGTVQLSYVIPNWKSMHEIRVRYSKVNNKFSLMIDGVEKASTTYVTSMIAPTKVLIGCGVATVNTLTYQYKGAISDISISNIDRGDYSPTLPQDFIDGTAVIKPSFTPQRSVYSDAMYSETRSTIVRIGNNEKQFTNSRTTGNWTSGDTLKVKGMGGEIIGGVIDSDTALARVVSISGTTVTLDNVTGIANSDTVKFLKTDGTLTSDITLSSLDSTNKTVVVSSVTGLAVDNLLFETTASTSSPLVKTNITGTAQAGASTTITLPTTFSATDSAYNNLDIMITAGTGIGQRKTISAYVGATKIATVPTWTVTPDATSVFVIYNVPVAGISATPWSNTGTNEATFTFGTNPLLTNQDIIVDYSLNEVAGQGQIELFTKTLGAEYNGRKLVNGTVTIRDDFSGKESGSTVACPHKYSVNASTTLVTPSQFTEETNQSYINLLKTLDSSTISKGTATNLIIPQQPFSFNMIRLFEDKYGEIPSLDPVKWLKDNIKSMAYYWYGYGTCPSGNKGVISCFRNDNNSYYATNVNWVGTPSLLGIVLANADAQVTIDANGLIHFLAYTDASDGVTASTIYTDYIYLDVELNTPTTHDILVPENPRRDSKFNIKSSDMTRTKDMSNKISGDTNRVPHKSLYAYASSLQAPSSFSSEATTAEYSNISSFDGNVVTRTTSTDTYITQVLSAWNLIRIVEDEYGIIPNVDKITWLKNNLLSVSINAYINGSSNSGNGVSYATWNGSSYDTAVTNTSASPTLLTKTITNVSAYIDSNGYFYGLTYAGAVTSAVASVVTTDYKYVTVVLKDSAIISLPKLKSKVGNENILMCRKETKEVQTFFKSNENAKVSVFGEWNKPNVTLVGSTLAGGSILSSLKVFLTSISTRLAIGSIYNPKTKFDILDSFSIIDSTISSANGNGLNLYVNSGYTNLVSNLLETKTMGYNSANKGIKIGKINSCSNTTLQLEDSTGNTVLYLNQNDINNSVANYIPIACFLAKNINNEIVLVMCGCNATSKGQISLDGTNNGRIVVFSLPNRPLIK